MATANTGGFEVLKRPDRVSAVPPDSSINTTKVQDAEQVERQRVEDLPTETRAWFRHSVMGWMAGPGQLITEGSGWLPRSQSLPATRLEDDLRLLEREAHTPSGWVPPRTSGSWAGVRVANATEKRFFRVYD
jgi:hypothetical protein